MSEQKSYTEADLKKLSKPELEELAKQNGVSGDTIPKLVKAILDAQDENPIPADDSDPGTPANDQAANDQAANVSDSGPISEQPSTGGVNLGMDAPFSPAETESTETDDDGKPERIKVKSSQTKPNDSGGYRIAFRETHADHPHGEVWIADHKTHTVAKTLKVQQAILDGRIVEVGKK